MSSDGKEFMDENEGERCQEKDKAGGWQFP